ncbi:hypothetical protein KCP75_15590 [Salmonella enterica subsp. enterica]|nr:hypothetical protein KCP75_15590 [Salmonella enterica subsp. enterica]
MVSAGNFSASVAARSFASLPSVLNSVRRCSNAARGAKFHYVNRQASADVLLCSPANADDASRYCASSSAATAWVGWL